MESKEVNLMFVDPCIIVSFIFHFILLFIYLFFAVALRPNAGHDLLILEVSRSHTTTRHSR